MISSVDRSKKDSSEIQIDSKKTIMLSHHKANEVISAEKDKFGNERLSSAKNMKESLGTKPVENQPKDANVILSNLQNIANVSKSRNTQNANFSKNDKLFFSEKAEASNNSKTITNQKASVLGLTTVGQQQAFTISKKAKVEPKKIVKSVVQSKKPNSVALLSKIKEKTKQIYTKFAVNNMVSTAKTSNTCSTKGKSDQKDNTSILKESLNKAPLVLKHDPNKPNANLFNHPSSIAGKKDYVKPVIHGKTSATVIKSIIGSKDKVVAIKGLSFKKKV